MRWGLFGVTGALRTGDPPQKTALNLINHPLPRGSIQSKRLKAGWKDDVLVSLILHKPRCGAAPTRTHTPNRVGKHPLKFLSTQLAVGLVRPAGGR